MKIDPQTFLDLVENNSSLAFVDIEATGVKGDYNSVLVVSVKPYNLDPISFAIKQPGNDQKVVREAKEFLEGFNCWVTYYGKGFDIPMLNTRLLKWKLLPIQPRHHIDLYYTLKSHILTGRRSQAHLLEWLETPQQKMTVSGEVWNRILYNTPEEMKKMVARCESDAVGLEALYKETRHLIRDIKS